MRTKLIPQSRLPAKLLQGLAAGIVGAFVAVAFFLPGWLDHWEARTWDWRVNLLARPSPHTEKIRLIFLDQASLDWAAYENHLSWPWPREVYGPIIQFCKRAGARSLAFDVLFTEPSRYGVWDDNALADEIAEFPVAAAIFLSRSEGARKNWPEFLRDPHLQVMGLERWAGWEDHAAFSRATFPVDELASASTLLANVNLRPDPDNVYRRISFLGVFDGRVVPSLGLASYLASDPNVPLEIHPGVLSIGGKEIPVNDRGQAILNFRGPSGTHLAYSAASIIQSELRLRSGESPVIEDLEDFRDAYVLFGFSAPGLFDLRPTPLSGVYPGVEIFATMLDNILSGDFIRPVSAPPAV
ncbi:MAG: CHASE2 domain-containing protein, partial [Syntrophales bacterium]|nr:CHASE2 domain-containing protein [Syntrophales bacterium]